METWYGHWLGCRCATSWCDFDLSLTLALPECLLLPYLTYPKYIWIDATDYFMHSYVIVLSPLTGIVQSTNKGVSKFYRFVTLNTLRLHSRIIYIYQFMFILYRFIH